MSRKKISLAYFSPLPPIPSGISKYSEVLLRGLKDYFDLDIFIDDYQPELSADLKDLPYYHYLSFYHRQAEKPYPLILYQLGNSRYHRYMLRFLNRFPGLVVLHDLVLHHFFLDALTEHGKYEEYLAQMEAQYSGMGRELGQSIINEFGSHWLYTRFPLSSELLNKNLAVIVHNQFCEKFLKLQNLSVQDIFLVPIPVSILEKNISAKDSAEILLKFDLVPNKITFGAFGQILPHKRLDRVLQALALLKAEGYYANLLIVGKKGAGVDLESLVNYYQLQDCVALVGHLSQADYSKALQVCSLIFNLRYPDAGETSATLLDGMAAGKAVVVTDYGQFREIPSEGCFKVEIGNTEVNQLQKIMQLAWENPKLLKKVGESAKSYLQENHNPALVIHKYREIIKSLVKRRNQSKQTKPYYAAEDQLSSELSNMLASVGLIKPSREVLKPLAEALKDLKLM